MSRIVHDFGEINKSMCVGSKHQNSNIFCVSLNNYRLEFVENAKYRRVPL